MALVGVVKAVFTADTSKMTKEMTKAQKGLDNFSKSAKKVGKSMTMKVTAPLVGVGVAAAKMASDFEFSMTQIETLVGRSAQEVNTLKGAVLGLSGQTGRAPKELADAMFFITSAGLDASSATAALEASAKAAAVGLGDTVVVADAVTNAMNGYGMAADGAAFATDVLAKTVEQGKASAADLAPQFGRLIPMAAELGISFDQVGGGLAFLTRASGDAAMSATQLGGVMKSILKPSQMAKGVMEEIGINLHDLRAAASEDLLGALQGLRQRLEENGLEMSNVFEDIRGLNGALQLTGVATNKAREVFDELADSSGKLDEAFLGVQKTAQFQMTQAMSAMKASMITLGEAILPVVVPMLQGLASVIESLAGWFGSLSAGMRTTIVVIGVIAAGIGPLLMVVGALTSSLVTLGIVSGTAAVSLGAVLLPLTAIVAVGAIVFSLFNKWGKEAEEAAGRQQLLTDGLRDMNDPATTMVSRIDELVTANVRLKDALDDSASANEGGADAAGAFVGQATLQAQIIKRDVVGAFDKLGLAQADVEAVVKTGTDAFNKEYDALNALSTNTHLQERALRGEEQAVIDVAAAVRQSIADKDISLEQGVAILRSLDETADAYDDHTKTLEDDAKAYLSNAEHVQGFVDLLGAEKFAQIKAAGAGKTHAEQLALYESAVLDTATAVQVQSHRQREAAAQNDMVRASEAELAAEERRLNAVRAGSVQMLVDNSEAADDYRDALNGSLPPLHEMIDRLNNGLGPALDQTAEKWDALVVSAQQADRAMLGITGTQFDIEDGTLANTVHWQGVANRNREEAAALEQEIAANAVPVLTAEERIAEQLAEQAEILQGLKDALQQRIYRQEQSLELAEEHLTALEAQADAAREPVEALKVQAAAQREGFDAVQGMWNAEKQLADATQNVADIEAELTRVREGGGEAIEAAEQAYRNQMRTVTGFIRDQEDALERQKDLTGEIADLTEERAFIEQGGGEFQRGLLRTLNEQALAYHDITASVAELEGRQGELSADAIQSQKDVIAGMEAQAGMITAPELWAIATGAMTAEQATSVDVTARQAQQLQRLTDTLDEVTAAYAEGEATSLDVFVAQEALTEAVENALKPSRDLEQAQKELARMEKDATRIGLQLTVARDKQTVAQEKLTAAEETGARTAEAVAVIDQQLLALEEKRTTAINDLDEASEDYYTALKEANRIKDTTAIQDAELERLTGELEDAQWDLAASQYGVRDAEIALAEAGDKANDAIDRMTSISPSLGAELILLKENAKNAYPQFDSMRTSLMNLEPDLAKARDTVTEVKDAIAALTREMEVLNGTRLAPDVSGGATAGVTTGATTGGASAGAAAGGALARFPSIGIDPTAIAQVAGMGGAGLWEGILGAESTTAGNVSGRFGALRDALLGGHEPASISGFLASLAPSAATGGFIKSGGLVNVHAGETITPRGGGGGVNITINVEGSVSSERDLVESIRKGLLQAQKSGKAVVLN